MAIPISVAHDFTCAWCWVGLQQIRRLRKEFDVEIEWLPFEQTPATMDFEPLAPKSDPADKPRTPSRFQLILAADGLLLPLAPKPPHVRTFYAHQAALYARTEGVEEAMIERIYDAFWNDGRDINNLDVLMEMAEGLIQNREALRDAMENLRFASLVTPFDEPAHAVGVYNLPTITIGGQRLAEQPYNVIRRAVAAIAQLPADTAIYSDLQYTNPHSDRPYVFVNMVTTIDGKIITGERGEPVGDLGSKVDHFLMHRLESKADAILSGANSLRATGSNWNPKTDWRIVVTGSGNIPWESQFMTLGKPVVITTEGSGIEDRPGVTIIRAGVDHLDWPKAFAQIKALGIEVLNVLGGSEINAQILTLGLVDELFLTMAPKIKLGAETPTYADGKPLPRELVQTYNLASSYVVGDEVFLRYTK